MQVDTHVHFWKYDKMKDGWITDNMKILQQDYLPQTISSTLKGNDIDGCVAVQVDQAEVETLFLIELAKTHDIIKGVIGWVDLQNENIEERLRYFSQFPVIKGWRHIVQSEPDDFLLGKNFQRGIRALQPYGYTYDVLIYHHQLKPALEFVSQFPEQKIVIDHCAKPDIANKKIDEWKSLIQEIAKHPHVFCKLSGLFTEAKWKQWSPADFYPYLDVVFNAFGTDRLMFGSDWPVILLSAIYVQWKSLLEKYMENFDEEDREKIFGSNAVQFYNLN
jgi:L-fuconolactonase